MHHAACMDALHSQTLRRMHAAACTCTVLHADACEPPSHAATHPLQLVFVLPRVAHHQLPLRHAEQLRNGGRQLLSISARHRLQQHDLGMQPAQQHSMRHGSTMHRRCAHTRKTAHLVWPAVRRVSRLAADTHLRACTCVTGLRAKRRRCHNGRTCTRLSQLATTWRAPGQRPALHAPPARCTARHVQARARGCHHVTHAS